MKKQKKPKLGFRRVTEIISRYKDFSAIPDKMVLDGKVYTAEQILERAADRGTRIHSLCELYVKNMLFQPVDEDCQLYFESFARWFDSTIESVVHTEKRLYCNETMITGQVDLIAKIKGSDMPTIIDIKTPQTECKTWRLQTAAYRHLVTTDLKLYGTQRACLMLNKKGGDAKLIYHPEHLKDNDLFFSALKLFNFFNPKES